MIIEDGKAGYTAKVNSDNQLSVSAVQIPLAHYQSHEYYWAWIFYVEATTDGTDNCILTFKNNGVIDYTLCGFQHFCTTNAIWSLKKDGIYSSGGTLSNGINMNFQSNTNSDLTVYTGNDIVETGAINITRLTSSTYQSAPISDFGQSFILSAGKSMSLYCNAASGTAFSHFVWIKHPNILAR